MSAPFGSGLFFSIDLRLKRFTNAKGNTISEQKTYSTEIFAAITPLVLTLFLICSEI